MFSGNNIYIFKPCWYLQPNSKVRHFLSIGSIIKWFWQFQRSKICKRLDDWWEDFNPILFFLLIVTLFWKINQEMKMKWYPDKYECVSNIFILWNVYGWWSHKWKYRLEEEPNWLSTSPSTSSHLSLSYPPLSFSPFSSHFILYSDIHIPSNGDVSIWGVQTINFPKTVVWYLFLFIFNS